VVLLRFVDDPDLVPFEPVVGKGGKAQSRLVNSGEGGLRGAAIAVFLGAFHGDRRPVALTGELMEPLPLLAGVSSPAKEGGTVLS
jgi:hypothetical protein